MSNTSRRRSALFVALLLATTGCASGNDDTPSAAPVSSAPVGLLDADAFAAYIDTYPDVPVINVHVPYEGHVAGTDSFVPFDEIAGWEGLPADRSAPIALYCRSGNMSAQATADLMNLGYTNIVDLDGGTNAWTASGRELLTELGDD